DEAAHEDEAAHDHDHGPEDPHFFTDPARMADAVDGLATCVAEAAGLDSGEADSLEESALAYESRLDELDSEVEEILAPVTPENRVLVTDHEVFSYFADRYGFEVAGTIIPSTSSQSEPDARALADLADLLRDKEVSAVFTDSTSSPELSEALAGEVDGVSVVALHTESLSPDGADTYEEMVRSNASKIADALGGG
ncbi:MAG: zinc ABC transporter substrate-binding protein, partial [Microthrixaceae bacterium]|nr:zinc ABC transporter substrate-binding protein [Microthrixaceae bacterium]